MYAAPNDDSYSLSNDSGGSTAVGGLTAALSSTGYGAIAAAAIQLGSGYQQAQLIRQNAEVRKQIDGLNIAAANQDSFNARAFGDTEAARYQSTIDATVGKERADLSGQGVDVNYGSAAEVQADSRIDGMLSQLDIQQKAYQRAQGYIKEANNTRLTGGMYQSQMGQDAATAEGVGDANALKTLISGYTRSR